jgi:predicted phosphodiesterase
MKFILRVIFFFLPVFSFAQTEKPYSVYLIGDAGEDTVSGKALLILKEKLNNDPSSTVIFLGDNIYPAGLKKNDHRSELKIRSQLEILKDYKGRVYFIPGNHDWAAQKRKGLKRIIDQKEFVEEFLRINSMAANKNEATFLPANGLPGPESILLNPQLRLIIIDTQWFLHAYRKNKLGTNKKTEKLFYRKLDSLISYSKEKGEEVIIAAHHPMYTNGAHSRKMQPLRFCINYTPLQIFGQFGLNRLFSQDLPQPKYKKMRKRILACIEKYDHVVYASGHDHNLQFFKEKNNRFIVSGCGSKTEHLRNENCFSSVYQDDSKTGFVKLEYFADKIVTTIYRVGEEPKILTDY